MNKERNLERSLINNFCSYFLKPSATEAMLDNFLFLKLEGNISRWKYATFESYYCILVSLTISFKYRIEKKMR